MDDVLRNCLGEWREVSYVVDQDSAHNGHKVDFDGLHIFRCGQKGFRIERGEVGNTPSTSQVS